MAIKSCIDRIQNIIGEPVNRLDRNELHESGVFIRYEGIAALSTMGIERRFGLFVAGVSMDANFPVDEKVEAIELALYNNQVGLKLETAKLEAFSEDGFCIYRIMVTVTDLVSYSSEYPDVTAVKITAKTQGEITSEVSGE